MCFAAHSVSRAFVPPWSHPIVADCSRTRQLRVNRSVVVVQPTDAKPGTLAVFKAGGVRAQRLSGSGVSNIGARQALARQGFVKPLK